MQKKIIVLIDGGFLRVQAKKAKKHYVPSFIQRFALGCTEADEDILRILYYDCSPYSGTVRLPVSGDPYVFSASDQWLHELANFDLFAVRRGVLKFRGYKPKRTPVSHGQPLSDSDFKPDFEQKGVDMRIGLDIAAYSADRLVDRIMLVTNDTDCVPAMKFGRKAGLQIVLAKLPDFRPASELVAHADFRRAVSWP